MSALAQRLGFFSCTAIIISNMIGTGIFTTTGFLAQDLGHPTLVLTVWLFGALIALCGALSYAELGINFLGSGAEYIYLREYLGRGWAFVNGWVSFFAGFSAPVAASSLALAEYFSHVHELTPVQLKFLAAGAVTFLSVYNLFSNHQVAGLQIFLTTVKVLALSAFLFFGLASGKGDWPNLSLLTERTSTSPLTSQFAVSLIFVLFAYSGWNAGNYVTQETKNPQETLPKSIIVSVLMVSLFYVLLNVLFIYALPLGELKGVIGVGAKVANHIFGPNVSTVFNILFCISLLATLNAMTFIGPRVYYAMAKDGLFIPWAAYLSPRWKSPQVSVLLQWACTIILIFAGSFRNIITYVGMCLTLFSILSVASLFKFRKRAQWKKLPIVDFIYPMIPGIFVIFGTWIIIYTAYFERQSFIYSTMTLITGFATYLLLKKKLKPLDRP